MGSYQIALFTVTLSDP